MQDTIEREVTINAPKERVYAAIADPTQIVQWFPDAVEGDLKVGNQVTFNFGEDGVSQIYIEAAQPHEYFAFRWVPGSNNAFTGDLKTTTTTLVEFRLEDVDGKTKVMMVESGFASLPADKAEASFSDNTGGWGYMLGRLEALFAQE